ncbi:MAG: LURP-one-related family protein [Ruthenibacterium sp.]
MKLYIKQKVFSIRDKFFVANENAENLYQVTGKIFSLGHKLTVQDMQEKEVVTIHQKVLSFLSKYFIASEGKEVEIERKISIVPHFAVKELDWDIKGNFLDHDYAITKDETAVATIKQKWISWGDSYEIDVVNDADVLDVLGVVIAIDCINADINAATDTAVSGAGVVAAAAATSNNS